jgi:hypothetical protein
MTDNERIVKLTEERNEWVKIAFELQDQKRALEVRLLLAEEMISAVHRICLELGIEPMDMRGEAP